MNKYILLSVLVILTMSCNNFLNTTDLANKNDLNFPLNGSDCNQALAAAYNSMAKVNQGSSFYIGDLVSDDHFGGGAANDYLVHGCDQWRVANPNMVQNLWTNYYAGIYRVNKLLESVAKITFTSDVEKKTILGEAYFLRGFFYSELSKVFGEVPLLLSSEPVNIPKTPAKDTYSQIASDLKMAIDNLPADKNGANPARAGHATKWAAESLLARVFLFYTGYYKQNDLPLKEGGSISKQQVVTYLEDVIANSGHNLVNDFRNLWPYTNSGTREDYAYTKGKGLNWAGDNNVETVFAIKYGFVSSWADPMNSICQVFGIRGQSNIRNAFPYADGYGGASINPKMVNAWITDEPKDTIRRWGSVIDVDSPREGFKKYEIGGWTYVEETKLFIKKYSLIHVYTDKSNADPLKWGINTYTVVLEGANASFATACLQDYVLIRYSDVLLMHSELTGTANGINTVRARAGLAPVSYSLENLQKERRFELAFEGIRYFDLLRWYGKEAGVIIDQNQNGADILNNKVAAKYNSNLTERIRATGGFFQIPENEISLSNGVLKQNDGWSGSGISL